VDPRALAKPVSLATAFGWGVASVDSVNSAGSIDSIDTDGGAPPGFGGEPDDRSGTDFGGKPYDCVT
jgi:hypothetical protein